jgi:hypothetical protein
MSTRDIAKRMRNAWTSNNYGNFNF